MKDFWASMNPMVAAFIRTVIIGVVGAALTWLVGFMGAYETPAGASTWFVILILAARTGVEGLYDEFRRRTGRSVPAPRADGNDLYMQ